MTDPKQPAPKQSSAMRKFRDALKSPFKKKQEETPKQSEMSKPDKYKTPAEKGVGVPGTSNNTSGWKPYTVPYTGAGAALKGTEWIPQRRNEIAAPPDYTKSHAAPPLYIAGERKTRVTSSVKDTKTQGEGSGTSACTACGGSGQQKKKTATTENDMFHPSFPQGVKPQDPQGRK
ncbi:hypothetical protein GGS26DRAFT_588893 [Hypomontagnella submonticulosa]|nr:hypothetical protein GGS26DRAFT_588893 [Hypomontagnella submonticulosa]